MTKAITRKIVGFEVVKAGEPAKAAVEIKRQPQDLDMTDQNRRIRLKQMPKTVTGSMRWPNRPHTPDGADGRMYYMKTQDYRFAVFITHTPLPNGDIHAFEAWVNGAEQPRGLGSIAKALSADMRQMDKSWIFHKLNMLAKTKGESCEVEFPTKGVVKFPSIVSAFAALLRHRLEELGYRWDQGPTPVMEALYFMKEPLTGPDGTMAWANKIVNSKTGDDFVLGLMEMDLPEDTNIPYARIPYSVWFSGDYPKALDGLCKVLSKDMQVCDPTWIALKLDTLRDYKEANADFLARVPGENRQTVYPSTEAYVAALIAHRYQMLGILDGDWQPVKQLGLLDAPKKVVSLVASATENKSLVLGEYCNTCGMHAVIKRDGCKECTNCGERGECG
jgi:ribonucleoside-diphosphate reductase alpha chain